MLVTSHAILKNGFQETLASSYHTCPYFQKLLNRHFEFRHSFTEIVDICILLVLPICKYVYVQYTTERVFKIRRAIYLSHLETQCV